MGDDPDAPWVLSTAPRQAHLAGFDLHANVDVPAADRGRLALPIDTLLSFIGLARRDDTVSFARQRVAPRGGSAHVRAALSAPRGPRRE